MAQAYVNKYVSDIPLKRPQETFVDDPTSLEEVSLAELEFDLANDVKDINNLHVLHAVAILRLVLEDLVLLGSRRDDFLAFRRQQLEASGIDVDQLQGQLEGQPGSRFHDDDLPLPVSILGETAPESSLGFASKKRSGEELTGDRSPEGELPGEGVALDASAFTLPGDPHFGSSLAGLEIRLKESDNFGESAASRTSEANLAVEGSGSAPDLQLGFISTESLVQLTSLEELVDPNTTHCIERLRKEVYFHMTPKIKTQANHLVRCFSLAKAPLLLIEQFLLRIRTYLPSISTSVYIHSAYMVYKLCVLLDVVQLTPLNVYRFILAALRCLTKKLEDVYQKQQSFATVGGVAPRDLAKIEVSFLYLFNFKMVVSEFILNRFLTLDFLALRQFCDGLRKQ